MARANKYLEAAEAIWIQYFVAFDNQEQRTLARTLRPVLSSIRQDLGLPLRPSGVDLRMVERGSRRKGVEASAAASGYAKAGIAGVVFAFLIILWLYRRFKRLAIWRRLGDRLSLRPGGSIIAFYEQMQRDTRGKRLRSRASSDAAGICELGRLAQAVQITERYNGVRFGKKDLNNSEAEEIENWLHRLSKPK